MKLKVKFLKWSSGIPGAMLSIETAKKMGLYTTGRISIKTMSKHPREISTVFDTIEKFIKEDEVLVSLETKKRLKLKKGQKVDVNISRSPRSVLYIRKKLEGKILKEKEVDEIIIDVVNNSLSEPEIAIFVSAMCEHGMNFKETIYLINAILKTGNRLNLKEKLPVDKHSIGGVAGNRTTPLVISICAATGLIIPKTSSKAITSAAGTADVISTIAEVEFEMKDLKRIISKAGAFMVWGGALGMVPADSKIIKVEKALKIDPESQLLASIMSKKLAVGSKYLVIDIPYGKSAKVTRQRALKLKEKFEKIGRYFHIKMKVVLTDGSQPIGNGIGPALELIDVINILDPKKKGPKDLEEKSLFLAAQLLEMTHKAKKGQGEKLAEEILHSGKAFEKFKEIIKAQKGKLVEVKPGKFKRDIFAKRNEKILEIDNKKINLLARSTGCPADKYAGLFLHVHKNDRVKKGEKILTIYAESKPRLNEALRFYKKIRPIKVR